MYRNASEIKIAQLEQKIAFLESFLYLREFKKGLDKAISLIGGEITNKKEYTEKWKGFDQQHIEIEFTLPPQTKLSNPNRTNTWSVKAFFSDTSKKTGNLDIFVQFHSYPLSKWNTIRLEKDVFFDGAVGAMYGVRGIERRMKDLASFMKQNAPKMEEFAVGHRWIDMHPSQKQRLINELGMEEAKKNKWLFEN